jgi:predicted permease
MHSLLQDLTYGFRLLRRQPTFTAVAILVLTLGIGINTAAFSVVNTLLLKPRVGHIDDELVGVYSRHRERPDDYRAFSWADYEFLRGRRDLFRSVTAHSFGLVGLKEGDRTRRVFADIVTASYFETFGVPLSLGRTFTAEEERPGANIPVAVVSHAFWTRLGRPADIIGRELQVNLRPFTVIGVAPEGFGGSIVLVTPELFVPTGMFETMSFELQNEGRTASLADPAFRDLIVVVRLHSGATIASLTPEVEAATRFLVETDTATNRDYQLQLAPLSRVAVSTRPQVDDQLMGMGAMLLSLASVVLLIASFNLANMLLARGHGRRKELAIRLALGGGRGRLVRQLLTESILLALIGGAGGVLFSWWATRMLLATMPAMMPITLSFDSTPDVRILAATASFSMLAAVLFGLGPAWKLARTDAVPALKDQTGELVTRRSGWLRWVRTRDLLVMGQVALSLLMLAAAGLFVRGAFEAAQADPGFTLDRGIMVNVDASLAGYDSTRTRAYYRDALDALRGTPGVQTAGFATYMPFGEFQSTMAVQLPGPVIRPDDPNRSALVPVATIVSVSSRYFETMGIGMRGGREFTDAESFATGGERIVIIDETLARRLFKEDDPVGRQVQILENEKPTILRVVGVAGGVRPDLFSDGPQPFVYFPFGQQFAANVYFHAKTAAPTAEAETAMLPSVGRAIGAVDSALPFVALETRPMFRERNLVLAVVRAGAWIFASFGFGALILAAVGIYGVKSYLVSRRTREIGIRIALGAEPRRVVGMVVGEGMLLVGLGLVGGVALSTTIGSVLRGALFQGRALDVPVIAIAAVTLVATFMLASWLPSRRATQVEPAAALRAQ